MQAENCAESATTVRPQMKAITNASSGQALAVSSQAAPAGGVHSHALAPGAWKRRPPDSGASAPPAPRVAAWPLQPVQSPSRFA